MQAKFLQASIVWDQWDSVDPSTHHSLLFRFLSLTPNLYLAPISLSYLVLISLPRNHLLLIMSQFLQIPTTVKCMREYRDIAAYNCQGSEYTNILSKCKQSVETNPWIKSCHSLKNSDLSGKPCLRANWVLTFMDTLPPYLL